MHISGISNAKNYNRNKHDNGTEQVSGEIAILFRNQRSGPIDTQITEVSVRNSSTDINAPIKPGKERGSLCYLLGIIRIKLRIRWVIATLPEKNLLGQHRM